MKRLFFLAAALLAFAAPPAFAQQPAAANAIWQAPYGKSAPMTVGTPIPPSFGTAPFAVPVRAILISCTAQGTVVLQLADGSQVTLGALPPGIYVLPFQAVEVVSSTATATFEALG